MALNANVAIVFSPYTSWVLPPHADVLGRLREPQAPAVFQGQHEGHNILHQAGSAFLLTLQGPTLSSVKSFLQISMQMKFTPTMCDSNLKIAICTEQMLVHSHKKAFIEHLPSFAERC